VTMEGTAGGTLLGTFDVGGGLIRDVSLVMEEAKNALSGWYGINTSSVISSATSRVTVYPIYVNGNRTSIGSISAITLYSVGRDYVRGLPTVYVPQPPWPTTDSEGLIPLPSAYYVWAPSDISAIQAVGSISEVTVTAGGAGYRQSSNTFLVDASTSTTSGGTDARLGLVLSAVASGKGRFVSTKSMLSEDRYLQSVDYYQPFAYVLSVEEDILRFGDALRRFVHPAGGLLLVRQTVTSTLDVTTSVANTTITLSV